MSDFNKSNVGFQQVGCRILTSRMSDVGCRILTSRMSHFYKLDVGFLQVGCRMAPISFRIFVTKDSKHLVGTSGDDSPALIEFTPL